MESLVGKRDRVSNYYSVSMGKIVKSLGKTEPEDMTGISKRVNKNGDTVYEIISDYIAGNLVSAELKAPPEDKPDWGSQMVLELESSGVRAKVNIPFDSAYGRGFMYISPNIDLKKEVDIEPYKYFSKKKGRDVIGISILQNGEKLDWAFGTKANPGGMPPLEKVKFKGKDTWDNTKQLEFLTKKFSEFCALVNATKESPEPVAAEQDLDF